MAKRLTKKSLAKLSGGADYGSLKILEGGNYELSIGGKNFQVTEAQVHAFNALPAATKAAISTQLANGRGSPVSASQLSSAKLNVSPGAAARVGGASIGDAVKESGVCMGSWW